MKPEFVDYRDSFEINFPYNIHYKKNALKVAERNISADDSFRDKETTNNHNLAKYRTHRNNGYMSRFCFKVDGSFKIMELGPSRFR